ncbi:YraN family protein [Hyalangium rubrum]|uniref:YraN family protein n=1 Tax=Hyalangium rubrum TaxID=3103134 RepID=UPI003BF4BC58
MGRAGVDRQGYGNEAETAAVRFLEARGYRIRARNFRCRYGELDSIPPMRPQGGPYRPSEQVSHKGLPFPIARWTSVPPAPGTHRAYL